MRKKRDFYVHNQSKLIEVAEAFADEIAGSRGSAQWKKVYNDFLNEAVHESILPADSKFAENPKISDKVMDEFPVSFGAESVIRKSLGDTVQADRKVKELRGVITQLTHLILESKFRMKVKGKVGRDGSYTESDFEFPKGAGENPVEIKQVYVDRYLRLLIFTAIAQSLEPVMKITSDEMKELASLLEQKSIGDLKSKQFRSDFIKRTKEDFAKKLPSGSIYSDKK